MGSEMCIRDSHSWVFLCFFNSILTNTFSSLVPFNPHSWVFLCFLYLGHDSARTGSLYFQSPFLGLSLLLVLDTLIKQYGYSSFNPHSWVFLCFISGGDVTVRISSYDFQSPFLGLSLLPPGYSQCPYNYELSIPILGSFFASQIIIKLHAG